MASKKSNAHAQKEQSSESKNVGPAGFALYEYLGENRDHTGVWSQVIRNLRHYVVNHYHTLVEEIIDKGQMPIVPEVDLTALMMLQPSDTKRATTLIDDQSEDEDPKEESTDSTTKTASKKPAPQRPKQKTTLSSTMLHTSEEPNPLFRYQMMIFDIKVQEAGKEQTKLENLIKTQVQQFYRIMWCQCGQSMQHF